MGLSWGSCTPPRVSISLQRSNTLIPIHLPRPTPPQPNLRSPSSPTHPPSPWPGSQNSLEVPSSPLPPFGNSLLKNRFAQRYRIGGPGYVGGRRGAKGRYLLQSLCQPRALSLKLSQYRLIMQVHLPQLQSVTGTRTVTKLTEAGLVPSVGQGTEMGTGPLTEGWS